MAVVINEFDVTSEPPPEKPAARTPQPKPAPQPDPREVERILREQRERCLRIWAH